MVLDGVVAIMSKWMAREVPWRKLLLKVGELIATVDIRIDENELCELANEALPAGAGDLHVTESIDLMHT